MVCVKSYFLLFFIFYFLYWHVNKGIIVIMP
jgi:hypothetical protein